MSVVPDIENNRSAEAKSAYSAEAKILSKRHTVGKIWQVVFAASTLVGVVALTALLLNIINSAFGFVATGK